VANHHHHVGGLCLVTAAHDDAVADAAGSSSSLTAGMLDQRDAAAAAAGDVSDACSVSSVDSRSSSSRALTGGGGSGMVLDGVPLDEMALRFVRTSSSGSIGGGSACGCGGSLAAAQVLGLGQMSAMAAGFTPGRSPRAAGMGAAAAAAGGGLAVAGKPNLWRNSAPGGFGVGYSHSRSSSAGE
jgi:hypothetical protein